MNIGRLSRATVVSAALLAAAVSPAGSDWDRYVPRKIVDVIDANAELVSRGGDYFYTASDFATKATVLYLGKTRTIPPQRADFLARYLGKMRGHPEWVDLYKREILCREGDAEYWLPIQDSVLEYFRKEVAAGTQVYVLATWAGAISVDDSTDWVFLVNEFVAFAGNDAG